MKTTTVTLSSPVMRGETPVTEITLHEPNAGNLRGISLSDVLNMKTEAIVTLVPRISEPKLIESEMQKMGLRDLAMLGGGIANFFLTEEERVAATAEISSQTT